MIKPLRQIGNHIKLRMARAWLIMLAISAILILLLYFANQLAIYKGISPGNLAQDPKEIAGQPFYTGSIAYLGFLLSSAAASLLFMAAALLRNKSRNFWFLLSAGIFTTFFTLDDAFHIHDDVIPQYFHIPEMILYLAYVLFILGFVLYFFREIWNDTDFPLLGAALALLAISIFYKIFLNNDFMGEGAKIMGVTFWLTYFARTAFNFVNEKMRTERA